MPPMSRTAAVQGSMAQMYEPAVIVMVTVVPPDEGPAAGVMLARLGCTCTADACATNKKH